MKVLNFCNIKGGTGKSSLSYLSGIFLSSRGDRVLFLDLDPQGSLTNRNLEEKPEKTLYHIIAENLSSRECIIDINENLSIIPSEIKLEKVSYNVAERSIQKILKGMKYDYVIIDNPPNFNSLVRSGIASSDRVFIPSLISQNDFDSVVYSIQEIENLNEKAERIIVLNRTPKKESKEEMDYLESYEISTSRVIRFQNLTGLKRIQDRGESLDIKKNAVIKESISNLINMSSLVV